MASACNLLLMTIIKLFTTLDILSQLAHLSAVIYCLACLQEPLYREGKLQQNGVGGTKKTSILKCQCY